MAKPPLNLFGVLAIRQGFLRLEQLEALIEEQAKDSATPLGEIARRRGFLTARQVRELLELQRSEAVPNGATSFGVLLLENGLASPEAVDSALAAQENAPPDRPAPKIGEILVDQGMIKIQEREAILVAQRRLRGLEPSRALPYETQIVPPEQNSLSPAARPQGWLIQETGDEIGAVFPLGEHSQMGRLAEHDVPVPDMAASRDHAVIEYSPTERRHVLVDLESRNGTLVNGAPVVRSRPLESGDRIQIGTTVFRYVAGGIPGGGEPPSAAPSDAPG